MASVVEKLGDSVEERPLSYAVMIRGRERMRSVLVPHLGEAHALERANNIAQALVFGDTEPRGVAEEMLRALPCEVRGWLAKRVSDAWLARDEADVT